MKKYHHVTVGRSNGRVRTIPFGRSIKARISYPASSRYKGKRAKRGKGKGHVVSLLFDPRRFTLAQAKAWARSHGYSVKDSAKAGTVKKRIKRKGHKKVAA